MTQLAYNSELKKDKIEKDVVKLNAMLKEDGQNRYFKLVEFNG